MTWGEWLRQPLVRRAEMLAHLRLENVRENYRSAMRERHPETPAPRGGTDWRTFTQKMLGIMPKEAG